MKLLQIDSRTLSQKVYEELKHKMITAELLPGESISLRTVASQLGVSLMPVREALWQLERDKAVVVKRNRQIQVNQLTLPEFDELLELRLMLECRAAEEACAKRPDSAPAALQASLEAMWRSIPDSKEFLQRNHEYHMLTYSYGGMKNLVEMIESLWTRVGPYIYLTSISREDMHRSMKFHTMMLEALTAGDARAMSEALRLDLTVAGTHIRAFLEKEPAGAGGFAGARGSDERPALLTGKRSTKDAQ